MTQEYPVVVTDLESGKQFTLEPNGPWWVLPVDSRFLSPSRVVLDRETGEFIIVDRSVVEILCLAETGHELFEPQPFEGEV